MHSGGLGSHTVERKWQVQKDLGVKRKWKATQRSRPGREAGGACQRRTGKASIKSNPSWSKNCRRFLLYWLAEYLLAELIMYPFFSIAAGFSGFGPLLELREDLTDFVLVMVREAEASVGHIFFWLVLMIEYIIKELMPNVTMVTVLIICSSSRIIYGPIHRLWNKKKH